MHEKSERRVRPVVAAALMSAVLAVSVAACSSGSSRPQVASLSGRGNAPAQSTGATATPLKRDDVISAWAECLDRGFIAKVLAHAKYVAIESERPLGVGN